MSKIKKDAPIAFRITKPEVEKLKDISRAADISQCRVLQTMINTVHAMSIGDVKRLINEGDFLHHFEASKKLAEKLKIEVDIS
tara:strand:+ start:34 stop:282 length:249 start_codon:yes stop_codon:yes gene_type:complete